MSWTFDAPCIYCGTSTAQLLRTPADYIAERPEHVRFVCDVCIG